jgi:hypothetical protein
LATIADELVDDLARDDVAGVVERGDPQARAEQLVRLVERPLGELTAVEPKSADLAVPGEQVDEAVLGRRAVVVELHGL